MPSTSVLGPGVSTSGLVLSVSNASSPESFVAIANATDLKLPALAETVDVTNFGDTWRRRIPTLLDMGKISFKVFWEMEDSSHNNSTPYGLRYLLLNRVVRDWLIGYPDGHGSTDSFPAYVTSFEITAAIGKVFEAQIELSNSGSPSLV
jgi:hypothetical protein